MSNRKQRFHAPQLPLPDWLDPFVPAPETRFRTLRERMQFVIALARENVRRETGGPFGAAIFDIKTGRLIAPGVNRVVSAANPTAHAEIVAIAIAGQAAGTFDLAQYGSGQFELVASTEPCAMCFGAVPWSGVRRLVIAARDEDARAVGFDEGPKMIDWVAALTARGITVVRDLLREEGAAVLRHYADAGGVIYNGRRRD